MRSIEWPASSLTSTPGGRATDVRARRAAAPHLSVELACVRTQSPPSAEDESPTLIPPSHRTVRETRETEPALHFIFRNAEPRPRGAPPDVRS